MQLLFYHYLRKKKKEIMIYFNDQDMSFGNVERNNTYQSFSQIYDNEKRKNFTFLKELLLNFDHLKVIF